MNEVHWPDGYMPGFTDNFCSNEVIVAGLTATEVWPFLNIPQRWPAYYDNASDVRIHDGQGPALEPGLRFFFVTFDLPVESEVAEHVPPAPGAAARLAWHGWSGEGEDRLDIYHAWVIEDLPGGRVRILTQESQIGAPARKMAKTLPNPMINGHQDWLDGLVKAVRAAKA